MNILRFPLVFIFLISNSLWVRSQDNKINGLSMVASRSTIHKVKAEALQQTGSNFVAVMPYAFMPKADEVEFIFDTNRQWSGETLSGIGADVKTLQALEIEVMLKPHIWVGSGVFTGDIAMTSENDWVQFEKNYKAYVMAFVKLAEKNQVSLFCLGTELHEFVTRRPGFWCELIEDVKAVYSGQLTYAENWDTYQNVGFWDSLDFIGIDAYFPISDSKTPSLKEVNSTWETLKIDLESFSEDYQTKILFTEYGYRSIDFAGKEPWDSSRSDYSANELAQLNLLTGLHQSLWAEEWFAGGFLWKWFPNFDSTSERHKNRFTVQGKTSEAYLKSFYKQ
ncbi:glycoside hydrolase family 113 [Psychroflexus montanilacus]|uniref:glycoside hydrolase family 113 n=1 Tax=Psychroflexus montanilacus TaxID=2873598 RepID=UPI001CCA35D7|nr:glycoside hydrolase [Psychroflexus montanilacus]MBZ9651145.1 glycoside hydrolase [Psychroflexus montanilacus]